MNLIQTIRSFFKKEEEPSLSLILQIRILERAERYLQKHEAFLCTLLARIIEQETERDFDCTPEGIQKVIPMFSNKTAQQFGAIPDSFVWWKFEDTKSRIKYLNWLKTQPYA